MRRGWWLAACLFALLTLTLLLPMTIAFLWSLVDPRTGWFAPDLLPRRTSLHHWQTAFADRELLASVATSLLISSLVTALSAVLALPTAWALAKLPFRMKRAVELFVLAPLIVPGLVVGVGVGVLFFRLGLTYSIAGVVLVLLIGTLPLMIRILSAALEQIPSDLVNAARSLGATPLRAARHVVVPLARPGFLAGGMLSFIASFEEFEKTFIVGSPVIQTLTIKLWSSLGGQVIIFPNAAVVTFILLTPLLIIFALSVWASRGTGVLAAGMGKL